MDRIFGETMNQFAGGLADWATYWRHKNFLAIADKVETLHAARKLAGKPIPLPVQFALPILDAASLETEEDVQDLWAGLIANAGDPSKAYKPKKVFLETLRGMQGLDALILKTLADDALLEKHSLISGSLLNAGVLATEIGADLLEVQISLQSLARLGCVIDTWSETIDGMDTGYSGFRVNNPKSNFRLSHLGVQLLLVTSGK